MESWVNNLVGRDTIQVLNMTDYPPISQQTAAQWSRTRALINDLLLAKSQTIRTMHIVIGGFSLMFGAIMILRILNDARRVAKVQVSLRPQRFGFLTQVHPAETFPLVLACAIVIQEIVFVSVQSTALNSVLVSGCDGVTQVVFPSVFLFGYTTLVFGIETAIRGLRRRRFSLRGRLNTPLCIVAVVVLLLFTWIPTAVWPARKRCFGSLIWYPVKFNIVAIGILSSMLFLFVALATIIAIQLLKSVNVDHGERIAASRVIHYLGLASITYGLVLPFFIQAHLRTFDAKLTTSRLAEIPLFCSGITVSFMHLLQRVNASRLAIKPFGTRPHSQQRFRFFGPSDLEMSISRPIINNTDDCDDLISLSEKQRLAEFQLIEKPPIRPDSKGTMGGAPVDPSKWPLPPNTAAPQPAEPVEHKRGKSSYSIFPTRAEDIPRLPATVYTPPSKFLRGTQISNRTNAVSVTDVHEASLGMLDLPNPFFSRLHRRDHSSGSSATVQIGLRLSVAPATIAATHLTDMSRVGGLPPSSLRRDASDSSGESLGLPIQIPTPDDEASRFKLPQTTYQPPEAKSPVADSKTNPGKYLQVARNKVLPPTPRGSTTQGPVSGLRMNPVTPPPSEFGSESPNRSPPPNKPAPGWI